MELITFSDSLMNAEMPDKCEAKTAMTTVTVTAKGQITIPAELRKKLEITKGERLLIVCDGETLKIIPIPKLSKLAGADKNIFKEKKPSKETEKIRKQWNKDFEKRIKEA